MQCDHPDLEAPMCIQFRAGLRWRRIPGSNVYLAPEQGANLAGVNQQSKQYNPGVFNNFGNSIPLSNQAKLTKNLPQLQPQVVTGVRPTLKPPTPEKLPLS